MPNRRRVLTGFGAVFATSIAGCTDDNNDAADGTDDNGNADDPDEETLAEFENDVANAGFDWDILELDENGHLWLGIDYYSDAVDEDDTETIEEEVREIALAFSNALHDDSEIELLDAWGIEEDGTAIYVWECEPEWVREHQNGEIDDNELIGNCMETVY